MTDIGSGVLRLAPTSGHCPPVHAARRRDQFLGEVWV